MKNSIQADWEAKQRSIKYTDKEIENFIWSDINFEFSHPTKPNEPLLYTASQYLASVFKARGFDGVIYKSSVRPQGYNVALFKPSVVCLEKRIVFEVEEINYRSEPQTQWFENE